MTSELDEPRATPGDTAPEGPAGGSPASGDPASGGDPSGGDMAGSDASGPGSLADRLAAWTPPWSRPEPAPTATPEPEPPVPAEDAADPQPADEPDRDGDGAPVPVAGDPEPVESATAPAVPGDGEPATADVPEPEQPTLDLRADPAAGARQSPELDDPVVLRGAVEAMLMVVDEPVPEHVLAEAVQRPVEVVAGVLRELADEYTAQRRGFELRRAAGGWRIYTRDDFAGYVERFVVEGQQVRLTQAALETLAVVAYKQPVSRSRVSAIRGVNCDGVIRTLLTRGLIEECGSEPDSGAHLYQTSTLFLERMGIDSVAELPELAPFLPDDLPEDA